MPVSPDQAPAKGRGRFTVKPVAIRLPAGWLAVPGRLIKRQRRRRPVGEAGPGRAYELAGGVFGRLTVLPAICVAAWLITGLPLLLAGEFLPVPMLLIAAPLATALSVNALQRVPNQWPSRLPGEVRERGWMPWFGLLGTLAVAAAFMVWQLARNSPSVIATRTPGAYFQAGYWLAQHGSLPIPGSLASFGGPHAGLELSSIGFFQHGQSVVPAVTAGLPMLLAGGFWTSGVGGGTVIMPILGGLAVFSFGGLVGRLAGRQWAPAGALVLALTAPEIYTSRDAFSEVAVQVLLFGGMCLVLDALTATKATSPAKAIKAALSDAVRNRDDSVSKTLAHADEVIAGQPSTTTATTPATENSDGERTAPIPAVTSTAPPTLGGQIDAWSRRAQDWLMARSRQFLAWARTVTWRSVGSGVAATLTPERMLAALGGVALGLTALLSLGSLAYLIPAVVVAGVFLVARRALGIAFSIGIIVGCLYGIAAGYVLARPFADSLASILRVIGADAAEAVGVTGLVILLLRGPKVQRFVRKALGRWPLRWLPTFAGLLVIVGLAGLAARPYLQTVRASLGPAEARFVGTLQRLAGLRVDPTRLYSEDTLYWVIWYAGIATVLLAGFGAALLVRRCLRALFSWEDTSGIGLNWALPLAIVLGGSAAVLWQPFTVPDQPWASRRLVPVVIPGLILVAIWAAAWLARRARDRAAGAVTAGFVSVFCVGAMLLPAVTTSFGVGLTHSGIGGGLRPSSGGIAQHTVAAGQTAAVRGLCATIGRSASVLILDEHVAADFSQVIRGMCGVPVAWMKPKSPTSAVEAVLAGITKAGRHPVLLGAKLAEISGYGGSPTLVMNLSTTQESHELTQAAQAPWKAKYVIWMAVDDSPAVGI